MQALRGFQEMMGVAAWTSVPYNRALDDGYERTTRYDGYPAHEAYEGTARRAGLNVLVGDRFLVNAEERGTDVAVLKTLAAALGLDALARMARCVSGGAAGRRARCPAPR